jgi:hypothetical protein
MKCNEASTYGRAKLEHKDCTRACLPSVAIIWCIEGTFKLKGANGSVISTWCFMFQIVMLYIFNMCLYNNVSKILWKHVKWYGINLISIKCNSKKIIKHCKQCFSLFNEFLNKFKVRYFKNVLNSFSTY